MSTKQTEALREILEIPTDYSGFTIKEAQQAQAELRRLHEENERLRAQLEVSEAASRAAVQKAEWQAQTNSEMNSLQSLNAELLEALKRMLASDKGIAAATDSDLQAAVNDQAADPMVREQAAAVLQSRAAITRAGEKV